jgi:hypothetical protein
VENICDSFDRLDVVGSEKQKDERLEGVSMLQNRYCLGHIRLD